MYGQGNAERQYYTPKESAEGELETNKTVYCQNEDCADFEVELDADLLISYYGSYGTATYTCPTCKADSTHEFEVDEYDFGYDPDAREGK